MTYKQFDKSLYQAMKVAKKSKKIKLSAEHDIYKKIGSYFFNVFYKSGEITDGKIDITLDIYNKEMKVSESAVRLVKTVMNTVMGYALKKKIISVNPAEDVDLPKQKV